MIFYPPRLVRFYFRYLLIFILILLPLSVSFYAIHFNIGEGRYIVAIAGCFLALLGTVLIHIGFWEKFFATITFTDEYLIWRCPFRKKMVIRLSDCVEIGAYVENANKGIPSEQIYFSDHVYPQRNMNQSGIINMSSHFIKFWYSEELSTYLIKRFPSNMTGILISYCRRRRKR